MDDEAREPVPGQRTITHHPGASDYQRWWGKIDAPGYPGRVWKAQDCGSVEQQMNESLGTVPTRKYTVTE